MTPILLVKFRQKKYIFDDLQSVKKSIKFELRYRKLNSIQMQLIQIKGTGKRRSMKEEDTDII